MKLLIVTYCLLAAALSGCGLTKNQLVKTHSFGSATASIGKLSEEEFVIIRKGIIEMNQHLVIIDNTKAADSIVFDKPAFIEPTAKRVAASKALKHYGELLTELASTDRSENLQKSANALLVNTSVALDKELAADEKDAINRIVVGLGSFWVEKKKAEAIKDITRTYQVPANELADLLQQDFSLDDETLGYLKAYDTTARRLKNAAMKLVNAGDKYSVLERDRAVQALVIAESSMIRASELSAKAKKSIQAFKKANGELVRSIENEKYETEDIKAYAKQIQELVNMYQVLAK